LRSNLLMATNSAKSSMSIFSSWLAAPNSGVITYIGTSTCGTIAASPWPMPEVSTMIRSKPATLQAAITSGSAWLISLPVSRVARLRMKTRAPCRHGPDRVHADAVAQQRAAALAPRRVDADHRDAQRVVLVQPQAADQLVGQAGLARAAGAGDAQHGTWPGGGLAHAVTSCRIGASPFSSAVISWARRARRPRCGPGWRPARWVRAGQVRSQRITISPIMPARPMRWPSSGLKMRATP
jgi:hypothetical protein